MLRIASIVRQQRPRAPRQAAAKMSRRRLTAMDMPALQYVYVHVLTELLSW